MHSLQKITFKNQQLLKMTKKSSQRIRWRKQKNSSPPIFISKTYQILQNDVYKNIITWNEQGTNFIIKDVQKFEQEVLPVHFRHRNFSSFVRQLNMYDFHKIRNDSNINIFEHKEFRRHHRQCLKNIKRKGCTSKKSQEQQKQNYDNVSISEQDDIMFDNEETPRYDQKNMNQDKFNKTIESIGKISNEPSIESLRLIQTYFSPTPEKKRKMQQFINSLPEIIESQDQIQTKIKQLKKDPKYECLNTKKDIRKLISKIKRKLPKRNQDDDLEELSIQQQILAEKIDQDNEITLMNPSLAILETEKFLPRSMNLIGSMNFCQDMGHLFFQKLY